MSGGILRAHAMWWILMLFSATAYAYPTRYPVVSEGRRRQVVEEVRRGRPELTVEADAHGFIQYVTGPTLTDGRGGIEIVRRHAALFGVDDVNALKPIASPQSVVFVQYLDAQIVARIQIEHTRVDRREWRIVGHHWPHLVPAAARSDGQAVRKRLVGGRVRQTEGGWMYPCDPVSGDHRDCPPPPPPKITEWDVTEKEVMVRQRAFLVRARDGAMELRTVWHASVDLRNAASTEMVKGASRLLVDAVTGEDLTSRIPNP